MTDPTRSDSAGTPQLNAEFGTELLPDSGKSATANTRQSPEVSITSILLYVDEKMDRGSQYQERKLSEGLKEIKKNSFRFNLGVIAVAMAGGLAGLYGVYKSVTYSAQELIAKRLNDEFSSENIQHTIENSAKKFTDEKAASIIKTEIDAGIEKTRAEINDVAKTSTSRLDEIQRSSNARLDLIKADQGKVAELSQKQRRLLNRTAEIYKLTADASDGSYPAYLEIVSRWSSDLELRSLIEMNLRLLYGQLRNYATPAPVPLGETLTVTENGKVVDATQFTPQRLIAQLEAPVLPDNQRQILAAILASKNPSELIDPAIEAFRENRSLFTLATLYGRMGHEVQFKGMDLSEKEKIISLLTEWKNKQSGTHK